MSKSKKTIGYLVDSMMEKKHIIKRTNVSSRAAIYLIEKTTGDCEVRLRRDADIPKFLLDVKELDDKLFEAGKADCLDDTSGYGRGLMRTVHKYKCDMESYLFGSYKIMFTRDIDWTPGTYGDVDSCFWGCRSLAKDNIILNGGFAIKIHTSKGNPVARCWGVIVENALILFNFYSSSNRFLPNYLGYLLIASLLDKEALYPIGLCNIGSTSGQIYVNGGEGYVIADIDQKELVRYDLNWDEIKVHICGVCGMKMLSTGNSEIVITEDGGIYCSKCAETQTGVCMGTFLLFSKPFLVKHNGKMYCDNYYSNNFNRCVLDGKIYHKDDLRPIHISRKRVGTGIYVREESLDFIRDDDNRLDLLKNLKLDEEYNPVNFIARCRAQEAMETLSTISFTNSRWGLVRNTFVQRAKIGL